MKVLYSKDGWNLGVYDDNNYSIWTETIVQDGKTAGEVRQTNMRYYPKMHDALISLADKVSRAEAKSLHSYVEIMRSTVAHALESLSKKEVSD